MTDIPKSRSVDASKTNGYMLTKSQFNGHNGVHEVENVWQLKWPPLTHLAWNWQPTSLVCEVSHINKF